MSAMTNFVLMITVCSLLAWSPSVTAQTVAQSHFDQGVEGWSAYIVDTSPAPVYCPDFATRVPVTLEYVNSGGAPGGFVQVQEVSGACILKAPADFSGDWSAAYGGTITLEQKFITSDDDIFDDSHDVYIVGNGRTLYANTPVASRDAWGQVEIPLLAGYWLLDTCDGVVASEYDMLDVLAGR